MCCSCNTTHLSVLFFFIVCNASLPLSTPQCSIAPPLLKASYLKYLFFFSFKIRDLGPCRCSLFPHVSIYLLIPEMDCRTKPLTYNAMIQLHTITLTLARTYLGFYIFITFVFLHWLSTVLRARGKKNYTHTPKRKKKKTKNNS